jgi:hypothetical protein
LKQFKERSNVLYRKGLGRPSVDAETIDTVLRAFQLSTGKLIFNAIRELQMPKSAVHKVPHNRSELHAYSSIQTVQA